MQEKLLSGMLLDKLDKKNIEKKWIGLSLVDHKMTIKELYEFGVKNNIVDYDIEAQYADDGGYYYGSRNVCEPDIEIKDEIRTIII